MPIPLETCKFCYIPPELDPWNVRTVLRSSLWRNTDARISQVFLCQGSSAPICPRGWLHCTLRSHLVLNLRYFTNTRRLHDMLVESSQIAIDFAPIPPRTIEDFVKMTRCCWYVNIAALFPYGHNMTEEEAERDSSVCKRRSPGSGTGG